MKLPRLFRRPLPILGPLGIFLALATLPTRAASLTEQIDPPEASVGDEVTVSFTLQSASGANIQLPHVEGLPVEQTRKAMNMTIVNGALSTSVSEIFTVVPQHAGDFTIPAFDIHLRDGQVLHADPMKLHVLNGPGAAPANSAPAGMPPQPSPDPNAGDDPSSNTPADDAVTPPVDPDGRPAKVFLLITPMTTDAYVGQTIPLRIRFFIRLDANAPQDSLPTIEGSNFLMNDLSVRPAEDEAELMNEQYLCETWITAISAPKSGDFPLRMVHDTYWAKTAPSVSSDPLGNFFSAPPSLAHANIYSNPTVIHVHALPDEGRPANFTGAIGQFEAVGRASPTSVTIGEPVLLDFSIRGEGNFDYVRCPSLEPDPAWKTYVPSSRTDYLDQSRTQGNKVFRQAIIPQKNGTLQLPTASFSYFDPGTKKYVSLSIPLPAVTVTGAAAAGAPASKAGAGESASAAPAPAVGFLPNRLEFGSLRTHFGPAYRHSWFWLIQAALVLLLLVGALFWFLSIRRQPDLLAAQRATRQASLHELEQTMSDAVRRGDAPAFFAAARQSMQIQLGAKWGLHPAAVTLPQIAQRDPQLAEILTPLFRQADEILYSGRAPGGIDLIEWERRVREESLQLQPA